MFILPVYRIVRIDRSLGKQSLQEMMMTTERHLVLRPATAADAPRLETIREATFTSVFASFRALLGDAIYELAQAHEDQAQSADLLALVAAESGWEVYIAEQAGTMFGFVSLQLNQERRIGEIGLHAVHPDYAGTGMGTAMYEFAIARMHEAGMRVATVATGGDPSHAPARRASQKAGFSVEIPSVWMCRLL